MTELEQKEKDLKEKLEKEIPDGSTHKIGTDEYPVYTGKQGYIQYQLRVMRALYNYTNNK